MAHVPEGKRKRESKQFGRAELMPKQRASIRKGSKRTSPDSGSDYGAWPQTVPSQALTPLDRTMAENHARLSNGHEKVQGLVKCAKCVFQHAAVRLASKRTTVVCSKSYVHYSRTHSSSFVTHGNSSRLAFGMYLPELVCVHTVASIAKSSATGKRETRRKTTTSTSAKGSHLRTSRPAGDRRRSELSGIDRERQE